MSTFTNLVAGHELPDADTIKRTFGRFPTGVAAVCADVAGQPDGFVVSSFAVGISLDPPLMAFSAMKGSRTWARLREVPRLGVSILGADQSAICRSLAQRDGQRFAGIETKRGADGAILIPDAPVQFECLVYSESDAGDHVLVLLHILHVRADTGAAPLVYHSGQFHNLTLA